MRAATKANTADSRPSTRIRPRSMASGEIADAETISSIGAKTALTANPHAKAGARMRGAGRTGEDSIWLGNGASKAFGKLNTVLLCSPTINSA